MPTSRSKCHRGIIAIEVSSSHHRDRSVIEPSSRSKCHRGIIAIDPSSRHHRSLRARARRHKLHVIKGRQRPRECFRTALALSPPKVASEPTKGGIRRRIRARHGGDARREQLRRRVHLLAAAAGAGVQRTHTLGGWWSLHSPGWATAAQQILARRLARRTRSPHADATHTRSLCERKQARTTW